MFVLWLVLLAAPLSAGSSVSASVEALYHPEWMPEFHYQCDGYSNGQTGPAAASCMDGESQATAFATYGAIDTYAASGSLMGLGNWHDAFGYASASFYDTIVFEGPHATGYVSFVYDTWCDSDPTTGSYSGVMLGHGGVSSNSQCNQDYLPYVEVAFGEPFEFGAWAASYGHTYGGKGGGAFAHAILLYISVTDVHGDPLPNVYLGPSQAGIIYPLHEANLMPSSLAAFSLPEPDLIATPEPRLTLGLLGALGTLLWRYRRRETVTRPGP